MRPPCCLCVYVSRTVCRIKGKQTTGSAQNFLFFSCSQFFNPVSFFQYLFPYFFRFPSFVSFLPWNIFIAILKKRSMFVCRHPDLLTQPIMITHALSWWNACKFPQLHLLCFCSSSIAPMHQIARRVLAGEPRQLLRVHRPTVSGGFLPQRDHRKWQGQKKLKLV
jgi:hypothetical protein